MPQKTIILTLSLAELLYSIESKTHLIADQKAGLGASPESVALIKTGGDDMGQDQLSASIVSALSLLKTELSEYILTEEASASNSELQEGTKNLSLTLNALPSNFNEAGTEALVRLAHQFIVHSTLVD